MKVGEEGGEETSGNCLSYPVIFVDGSVALRGQYGSPSFGGAFVEDASLVKWYLQQDDLNAWQAGSDSWHGEPDSKLYISDIAWGDNLYARDWTTHSVVRVETVLYASHEPMTEFEMAYLFGEGPDEMQGTNGVTSESSSPTVFTPQTRLTIQRWMPESVELIWDTETKLWIGAEDPIVSGGYSAEINVKGKVVFGYNWFVQRTADPDDGTGLYRITMRLEDSDAVIDYENGLTYVDVGITDAAAGGGGGGGGNGGNGGALNLVADFEAGPTTGVAPLRVFFDDASTGKPISWLWNFGDENTSTEQNPIHVYPVSGTYTVRLTIEKGTQTDTETKYDYITVTGVLPETGTTMHIETIDMDHSKKGKMHYVETTVTVNDENQEAVSNATVELLMILPDSSTKTKSLRTGENGTVTFYVNSRLDGEYVSEVIDVSHSSREYKPDDNDVETRSLMVY